jgi:hypothetical protein
VSQRSIELSKVRKTTQNQCTGLSAGITHHRAILSYSPCIDMALYGLCDANATLVFNASGQRRCLTSVVQIKTCDEIGFRQLVSSSQRPALPLFRIHLSVKFLPSTVSSGSSAN